MSSFKVPMLDLGAHYAPLEETMLEAYKTVFRDKQFINGPQIITLEKEIAKYCGVEEAIGVSSGTDALLVALMALTIGAGDEVITTPFTFFATAGAIARVGAIPVFVDIDEETFNLDVSEIEGKITSKTKAIMPVHLFGQMADMHPILQIAKAHGLAVIEDAAQAIGSAMTIDGRVRSAGSLGDMGCFSFFPTKNLGGMGDGGMVVTDNKPLADQLRFLRNHGSKERYHHPWVGGNFRLDTLQAAFLLAKLPLLEDQHKRRQAHAAYYEAALKDVVKTPCVRPGFRMIYNQFTIRVPGRDRFHAYLTEQGIASMVYYPIPMHLQPCFAHLGHQSGSFPKAEKAAQEVISLPIYAELLPPQLDEVIRVVRAFFQ